ncbi:MAG TPA: hypothetical protein VF627_01695 [Abditibacterium sp.]|jgi:hypothetical protein
MAKSTTKSPVEVTTTPAPARKQTRLEFLQAQSEMMKKNPAIGIEIAERAGILDENGDLTPYFKGELKDE